jgi:pimeloyl-ACP methyl ester carboxylesterase
MSGAEEVKRFYCSATCRETTRLRWLAPTIALFVVAVLALRAAAAEPKPVGGAYANGELVKSEIDGRKAYLVRPTKKTDPARRWIWVAPFWLAFNERGAIEHRMYVDKFLEAGFHVAGVDVGTSCGSPKGAAVYQKFYERLLADHQLHQKARLLGQSNGGLISYAWAFRHPESVDRIGCIYPATDFRTWPGLDKVLAFPEPSLAYGLTLDELTRRAAEFNPIDNLAPLARAGVKIFHIHGDKDELVPMPANSQTLVERYKQMGGDAALEIIPGLGHGSPVFYQSESLAKFLLGD